MVAISLLLMSMVAGVLTRAAITQRQYSRATQLRTQAEWLVQSAGRRAAAKLATNSAYTGEIWNISAEELDQLFGAVGITPAFELDPFVRFKVFVVLEKMLDLMEGDLLQVIIITDLFVAAGQA